MAITPSYHNEKIAILFIFLFAFINIFDLYGSQCATGTVLKKKKNKKNKSSSVILIILYVYAGLVC